MMPKFIRFIVFIFVCGFLTTKTYSQQHIGHYTIFNGLSYYDITSVLEDSKGFLWVGTYDGLNKYDGQDFKIYRNQLDHKILESNRIQSLFEDQKGTLWIGSDNGITLWNREKDCFTSLKIIHPTDGNKQSPIIRKIIETKDHFLAISETRGILLFNKSYEFIQVLPINKVVAYYDILPLDNDQFLVTTSKGLFEINTKNKEITPLFEDKINLCYQIRRKGNTFYLTTPHGLCLFTFKQGKGWQFEKNYYPEYDFVCAEIIHNDLWLGASTKGFFKLSLKKSIENQTLEKGMENMEGLRASCIYYAPKTDFLWMGSHNKGLFKQKQQQKKPFKNCLAQESQNVLTSQHVISLTKYNQTTALVCTNSGGMGLFDFTDQKIKKLPFETPQILKNKIAYAFKDREHGLWLGAGGELGIYYRALGKPTFKKIEETHLKGFSSAVIRSHLEDRKGNIWLGCTEGVFKINRGTDGQIRKIESLEIHPYFKEMSLHKVRKLYLDPYKNYLWIGTDEDGLFRVTLADKALEQLEIVHFHKKNQPTLKSNFITSIIRLPNQQLWIGTEQAGLILVENEDKAQPTFRIYGEKEGLDNHNIKSIEYDSKGNLWISTDHGINLFDLEKRRFRAFSPYDGLNMVHFEMASYSLPNQQMLFASINGLCYFKASELPTNHNHPRLEFGMFQLFNKEIKPLETTHGRILLDKVLSTNSKLELKHNENVFGIELIALQVENRKNHPIRYRLLPSEQQWVYLNENEKIASFNGLQAGAYHFEAQIADAIGQWSESKSLYIHISPSIWQSTGAYFLYILFSLSLISLIMYLILRAKSLHHQIHIDQLELGKIQAINTARLQLFANISHEFRTPLTLISAPLAILEEHLEHESDLQKHLTLIQRQSRKMFRLIEQIHDYQKSEQNILTLKKTTFNFTALVEEVYNDFEQIAQTSHKTFTLIPLAEPVYILADRDKLEKVLNNLLNNAFKFTAENDEIRLEYHYDQQGIYFSITDTGKGISPQDLPHIFERFFQSENQDTLTVGSGIGLHFSKRLIEMHYGTIEVQSSIGLETQFKVFIPLQVHKENLTEHIQAQLNEQEEPILLREYKKETSEYMHQTPMHAESIFIVEDNPDLRVFMSEVLQHYFKVKSFENGLKCLEYMQEEWPDIIISDVVMPQMNGLELCQQIKSEIGTSHIPVILLTSKSSLTDRMKGLNIGADAYINKPFDLDLLIVTVENILKNRKQLRERFQIDFPLALSKKKEETSHDHIILEKLFEIFEQNLDNDNLEMDKVAKDLHLNRTHFYKKIKAITNMTPYELLKDYRLKKAAELIVNQQLPVYEAYLATGFKNRTHFSKMFKAKYGVSPSQYGKK